MAGDGGGKAWLRWVTLAVWHKVGDVKHARMREQIEMARRMQMLYC
jgi:hypothetical protein